MLTKLQKQKDKLREQCYKYKLLYIKQKSNDNLLASTGNIQYLIITLKKSTSALLTMLKPLIVWITTSHGKLLK